MTGGGMNIIIPMAGQGSRFAKFGYKPPKPLICIAGVPMVVQVLLDLKFIPEDTLYIGIQRAAEQEYHTFKKLHKNLLSFNITVVPVFLDGQTRGAAETLQIIIENMRHDHRYRRTVSLDCDTLYFYDILGNCEKYQKSLEASVILKMRKMNRYFHTSGSMKSQAKFWKFKRKRGFRHLQTRELMGLKTQQSCPII